MSNENADRLVARLNAGEPASLEEVYRAYEPFLRMVIRRHLSAPLRTKLDSMDVIQSVWADVQRGLCQPGLHFPDETHLRAFLAKAARNRLVDRFRQHRNALEHERSLAGDERDDPLPSLEPRPSEFAQAEELWELLLELCPPGHRDILRLKQQGIPLAEIAARTGFHESSVRRILYELARKLADRRATAVDV